MTTRTRRVLAGVRAATFPVLGALLLYGVLGLPNHPAALAWDMLLVVPLELPVILVLLAILPARQIGTLGIRALIVAFLTVMTVLKLADFGTFTAYNRGFNPLVDLHLLPAAWNLGSGTFGTLLAGGIVMGLLLAVGMLVWALWWATGRWAGLALPRLWRGAGAALLVPLTALAGAEIGQAMRIWSLPSPLPADIPGAAFTARVAVERVQMTRETSARLIEFRAAAGSDAYAEAAPLLDRIGQRDVLLTYIESYGASSLTNPRYAKTHLDTLANIEADLAARGLSMRSGWLEAPIFGGQSWMTHATLSQGLWIPDQRTYGAALISGRRSLFDIARGNGFKTVAVMPAITLDWPEAEFMGFDRIYTATDLGYEGLPFNWVTMPDQFTLTALDRLVLEGAPGTDRAPVFAQIALISSHAPWTPVPDLVDWDAVGDGRIFNEVAQSGDPPEVVWRDHDRVRDQFRQAIDYSLQTVGSYAARHASDPPFLIVLGDHQPASFVSEESGLIVPIHLIGSADLVEPFANWGWTAGMVPEFEVPIVRMDAFRDRFLEQFSTGAPTP